VIEPADIEEMLNYPKIAFELSEKFGIPVIFRITTRTAHSRGTITLNPLERPEANPNFEKNPQQLVQLPGHARINHTKLLKKIEEITEWAETSPINRIDGEIKGSIGIITSGVAYTYVKEALEFINEESPILKLGLAYPLPPRKITSFLEKFDKVLIIEEVDPFHEILIRSIAQSQGVKTNIIGKDQGLTPLEGELNLRKILEAFKQIEEYAPKIDLSKYEKVDELVAETKGLVPARPPILCAGCPHRATFFGLIRAMKRVKEEVIYVNDIGCYALGISMGVADALLCMGASIGMASGLAHSGIKEMPVAIIGDSTFFHSGINALVNAVYNKSNILVVIVDNYTTAMTGMQDSPRTGITGMGEKGNEISIEETCEGMGVKHIEVVDAYDSKESTRAFHRALEYTEGPSVVISRYPCIQLVLRDKKKKGEKIVPCYVDTEICNGCAICIDRFTCPAMTWAEEPLSTGKYQMVISITECVGCGSCIPVCARKAIKLGPEN
jgi:indolepyruvate ferredoxin oxidoreductase alpha subunit